MPLYEYRCEHCEHCFEILQRMGEGADGLTCPQCGEAQLTKKFSTFASTSGEAAVGAAGGRACGAGGFT